MDEKITHLKKKFSQTTLLDLLLDLDDALQGNQRIQIDLRGTDLILVESIACAHCGKQIPIYAPLSGCDLQPMRCAQCEDICVHSYESQEPILKTVTAYSFQTPKKILSLPLAALGFSQETVLSVIDQNGKTHQVKLR